MLSPYTPVLVSAIVAVVFSILYLRYISKIKLENSMDKDVEEFMIDENEHPQMKELETKKRIYVEPQSSIKLGKYQTQIPFIKKGQHLVEFIPKIK